ncbi:hypothetical protein LOTGIDRAFT_213601 [Lottia gigantea]|uniref:RZ-type domain-containing protein n=1 Tax=Lottia gigantea TaxID=225164 RepID=V4AYN5_LOTGI|nr:hypothetical protein LOTGIDRAFT_213601 [Lottia gigantea]ESO98811.1 hypothetical protein LOTGIDRAFT_213601 [Lottia gigantea]
MRYYEGKDPADILFSLGHERSGLYELLNLTRQNVDMVKLTVSVIAKGCTCNTAPQNKINILTKLISSPFLTIGVPDLLMKITTDADEEESQKTFKNVCEIVLALFLNIPFTCVNMNLLGLTILIEGVMDTLRIRTDIDDELMEIYQEIHDLKDKRLIKIKNRGLSDEHRDSPEELAPPDDFRDISVLPTMEDIDPSTKPFLRKNKVKGGYASSSDYLDVQFRLLREDFIQPLRNGIEEYQIMVRGENNGRHRFSDIRVYTDVSVVRSICTRTDLLYRLQFDVSKMKKVNWQISKRLIFGSLVCLSSDEFKTFYIATVCDRDAKKLADGYIDVKFEHQLNDIDAITPDQKFVMVETTAYYEAYKHVLKGLQDIGHVPFERYIVQSNSSVNPPRYLLDCPALDLRPLVDEKVTLRGDDDNLRRQGRKQNYEFSGKSKPAEKINLLNIQSWPNHELLNVDESQFAALQTALTKEFSVIQGPPGTGKTYVGLKIVKALLHNSNAWNYDDEIKRPMLIVCYTNHALDQFLEGISNFYDGKIVRVGSRISCKKIENYSIQAWRRKFQDAKRFRDLGRINYENHRDILELQRPIENVGQRIEAATRDILKEDELRPVMSPFHREQLSSSFYEKMLFQMGYLAPETPSLMLEWLGIAVNGTITNEMVQAEEDDIAATEEDEEGIVVEDERDIMTNNRLLDVDETGIDRNLEQIVVESIKHRREVIAFDVNNIDADKVTPNDGFQLTRQSRRKLKRNLLKKLNSRSKLTKAEADRIANIWEIDINRRWRLYRYWVSEHCNKLRETISELGERYKTKCETMKEVNLRKDKIIMTEATVIAMTTTGAARYQKILQEVNPRIIVVEEAAEVLEGHVITSLNAGCEQLILIGDHKQLRPNPNVFNLAVKYNLQISLFERMLKNGVHCDCLEIQHRMRPEISKLMKPIYPTLMDHFSVRTFDNVKGLAKNIFFIDHKFEEQHNEEMRSHSNSYEAEFISKLADYLLKQGYDKKQITVLTAYSGQIHQLKKVMPKHRFEGIRITPIDNFQGEENDIILLSLVRSNIKENIGFLKIENRVCVALSRARKGLYVIGNFGILASQSSLWKEMTIILKKAGELGENLLLQCQNHPNDSGIEITKPGDFEMAPLGGCQKLCNARLQCGHSCSMACHPTDPDHEEYSCPKPCTKTCKDGHPCKKKCYQECGDCQTKVEKTIPVCGHLEMVKCSVSVLKHKCTHPCESILDCGHRCGNLCGFPHQCQAMVKKKWPCGHTGNVKCVQSEYAVCKKPCGAALECGHPCTGTCSDCFSGRLHKSCGQRCTKNLICDHKCQSKCSYCPPCEGICENRCEHSKCKKKCGEICITCKEPCAWKCRHFTCGKKCFEPCDRPPCNHPCYKILKCGHECIGLCGEPCPNLCRICHKDKVTEIFFGTEDEADARFVQLKDCGHVIEYESLDNWMKEGTSSSETISIQMKTCPKCKTPIRRCVRYGSIINRLLQSVDQVKQTYIGNKTAIEKLRRELQGRALRKPVTSAVSSPWLKLERIIPVASTENHLLAIQNQLEVLTKIDKLLVKLKKVAENHQPLSASKYKEYDVLNKEFKKFVEWLSLDRMVFSNQELNDAQAEMKRLSLYLKFFNLIVTVEKRNIDLGILQKDIKQCYTLFSDGNPLTERDLQKVKETLKKIDLLAPASGLGISEEEKVMVVKAVGLTRGHWYKCRNGHPYVITECGGATEISSCPVCKDKIGGTNHRLLDGNAVATEMDGATHSAWSDQSNMENYIFDI